MTDIQTYKGASPEQIRTQLEASSLSKLVSDTMGMPRFIEAALQLLRQPGLAECTQESVLGGLLKAAIFNFPISTELGMCWLVPRTIDTKQVDSQGKKIFAKVAVFQIGYKGWQELAVRSGKVESFDFGVVWSADEFDFEKGTSPYLKHVPSKAHNSRGKRTHIWASATMTSGRVVFNVAPIEEVERHRLMSDTQSTWDNNTRTKVLSIDAPAPKSIWDLHYDQMGVRVPMRYLCQLQLPKSEVMLQAIEADGGFSTITPGGLVEVGQRELEETVPMTLHEDYITEIEAANSADALRVIFEKNKVGMEEPLRAVLNEKVTARYKELVANGTITPKTSEQNG